MTAGRDWRSLAACRDGVDPELFFPPVEVGPLCAEQVAAAKAVCARCPVREECLGWALDGLSHGIAGGLTEDERRGERQQRRGRTRRRAVRPVCGSPSEVTSAGRAAVREGMSAREAAHEFGVSERTAQRWAAQVHGPRVLAGQRARGLADGPVQQGAVVGGAGRPRGRGEARPMPAHDDAADPARGVGGELGPPRAGDPGGLHRRVRDAAVIPAGKWPRWDGALTSTSGSGVEESRGGSRALLRSPDAKPMAGTRALEGHRG
jgi:WhiB family redox-sensing transcriptional regulator